MDDDVYEPVVLVTDTGCTVRVFPRTHLTETPLAPGLYLSFDMGSRDTRYAEVRLTPAEASIIGRAMIRRAEQFALDWPL